MIAFNGTPLSYDPNGNLLNDGTNTYAWDARNHLTGISGAANASFLYDGFGRRMGKSIGGNVTQFLYDRLNPVQELDASNAPTANLLTGLNIDEYFQRADSTGRANLLTDTLGSTLALTDSTGALQTQYAYEPFGNTTIGGASSTNSYQFTGRENDGTGLYFYRARYYAPGLQRLISQDPIEFRGGDANLYAYAENDPVKFADPFGKQVYPYPPGVPPPEIPSVPDPSNQLTAPPSDSGYYCALKPSPPPPPPCSMGNPQMDPFDPLLETPVVLTDLGFELGESFELGGIPGAALGFAFGVGIVLANTGCQ